MNNNTLVPLEQKEVRFYGDEIVAVRVAEGGIYIPVRPICELLGVAWTGQQQRLQRDPVLSRVVAVVRITRTTSGATQQQTHEMLALPLEYLNGWLLGINASRIKPELQERIIRYQLQCHQVLYEAFREGRLSYDAPFEELLQGDSPEVQAYKMIMAMAQMARQQILLKGELERHDAQLSDHAQRLELLEGQISGTTRTISAEQAMSLSQAVKTVALLLGQRSGRNEFGGVYGELYRRFGIPSYRELPANKFGEAMGFLRQWWQNLNDSAECPF